MESKDRCKCETPKETNSKSSTIDTPVCTGRKFECLKAPDMQENSVSTLHSDMQRYKGPSQKEEVMLAIMNPHLNELKEEECVIPDLQKV